MPTSGTGPHTFFKDVWSFGLTVTPEEIPNDEDTPPSELAGCGVSVIDTDALSSEFQVGVLIDLKRKIVSFANECRFTCVARRISDCNAIVGDVSNTLLVADVDGYIGQFFDDQAMGWGSPQNIFQWTAADGDATTATITGALPIGADGSGMLEGLVVAKIALLDNVIELRRIASHDETILTVTSDWEIEPLLGDLIIAGPILSLIQWSEARARWPLLAQLAEINVETLKKVGLVIGDLDFDPWLRFDQYSTALGEFIVDYSGPAQQNYFRLSDLKDGLGRMRLEPESSLALSYRLLWIQSQRGPLLITSPRIVERISDSEDGR